jgi:hypothetical protein
MRLARSLMGAIRHDDPFVGDHAGANHGVRRRPAETPLCVMQRPPHPLHVVGTRGYHFS